MTSVPGRDDIIDQLRAAGVRAPQAIARIMRTVDLYALAAARRAAPSPYVPYPALQPGGYDPARAVICCQECGIVKHFTLFPRDKAAPHGRSPVCHHCTTPAAREPAGDPDQLITCKTCGETSPADGNYYVRKDNTTGYALSCKDCLSGTRVCAGCGHKRLARKYEKGNPLCERCRETLTPRG